MLSFEQGKKTSIVYTTPPSTIICQNKYMN
uniref:Uncharacterized protein n=1 Tax=Anguilla anguilla TaxID=7936 RepID=A0A0E9SGW8_ANGAN